MDTLADNTLMLNVKNGSPEKLGLLYERYKKMLFGYFFRITSDRIVSEDLVQNVFFRILRYRKNFREDGSFYTWMFSIAHNVYADEYRKKNVLKNSDDITETVLPADEAAGAEMESSEQAGMIRSALAKLNPDHREVLVLSRYHDLKYKEIARITGCSEGAVKVRIFRAMEHLRNEYLNLEKQV